jgi:hypothetical protein
MFYLWNISLRLSGQIRVSPIHPHRKSRKPLGILSAGNSFEEFGRILAADIARCGAVAKAADIRMEQ